MRYRKKMSRKQSRRNFRRGARHTKSINQSPRAMRGGIRM